MGVIAAATGFSLCLVRLKSLSFRGFKIRIVLVNRLVNNKPDNKHTGSALIGRRITKYLRGNHMIKKNNLFDQPAKPTTTECFETLLESTGLRLERIISHAHATPEGEWYDQDRLEWVLLLQGSACLRVEGESELVLLEPGDYLHLPSHLRHRVEWTDDKQATIWLALHYG
jgi:cupin 2 domain-containing protein